MKKLIISFLLTVVLFNYLLAQPAHQAGGDTTCVIVWEEPILLSDTAYDAYSPKIALSGDDTVHVVWESEKPSLRLPYRRSTDKGQTFENVVDLLIDSIKFQYPTRWNYITSINNNVYVFSLGGTGTNTPIHLNSSSDRGTTWIATRDINNDTIMILQSISINKYTLALVVAPPGYRRILRSTDAGATWTRTSEDLSVYSQIALSSSALHLVYSRGINSSAEVEYRLSHDLGESWSINTILSTVDGIYSDVPLIGSDGDSIVHVIWREAKYGCLGILGCGIASRTASIRSGSATWEAEEILTDAPRGYPQAISIDGKRHVVAWKDEIVPNRVFHTAIKITQPNSRTTWCPTIDVTPDYNREVGNIDAVLSKDAIHVVWQADVNAGSRWRIFYRRGIFTTTDVKDDKNIMPTEVSLSQNYPNPFNPKTNIGFRILDFGFVSLKVYDVFGREVATLVNEKKQPGEYEVEWNPEGFARQTAGGLASGVYFIRMNAGKYFMTKKAILIR